MRYALFLAGVVAWAGQGISLSTVRTQNASFTAMAHTAVVCEFELSGWSSVTGNDGMAELNAAGIAIDYSNSTTLRIASNWITGVVSASNLTIPLGSFSNSYLYGRIQYDNAGAIGPPKVFYAEAYDINGVEQFSGNITYTADTGTSAPGVYAGQNGNATVQRVHFMRCGTNLVPIGSRSPATADIGPLNANTWAFQWKFDGSFADATGNGWTAMMSDSSTPSGTCGSTATSYCDTQFQVPIPGISTSQVTWRAGVSQAPSGATSFSQSDPSPGISTYFWQVLSGPNLPIWSSHTTVAPTLKGVLAGDYNVQLIVTDATPATATTTQHIGVVATDSNDIVINSAGLPPNSSTDIILGPLQKWQSPLAPYPLFDQLHGVQWTLRSGPTGDFQFPVNGGSSYQTGTAYFDYAQAGTLSATQFSNILAGSGTTWTTSACSAGSSSAQALITTSNEAGLHTSDPFTIGSSNNTLILSYDGGGPVTVTLTSGSRTILQIVQDIATALGTSSTINSSGNCITAGTCKVFVLFNGFLGGFQSLTIGTSGSVQILPVSMNSAYPTLGLIPGTYTVSSTPLPNMVIIPWYLTSTLAVPNLAYPTGRRELNVLACLSDTSMVIEEGSGLNWRLPNQSGIQYALDNQSYGLYYNFDNNGNYYDTGLSDCAKSYKSGVATDIAQCRARVDRWFRGPGIDLGQEFTTSGDGTTIMGSGRAPPESRLLGLMSSILRALDGEPNYWPGLEYEFQVDVAKLISPGTSITDQYIDQRNFGYALQRVSACALFDPNPYSATCRAALVTNTAQIIVPSRNTVDSAYPYWPVPYFTQASYVLTGSPPVNSGSVCVVNGSTSVVGTGTNFTTLGGTSTIWFFSNPTTRPANNAAGDPTWYASPNVATVSASISMGSQTVTPSSMYAIFVGSVVPVSNSNGGNAESVTVTAVTSTTFTAVFTSPKTGPGILVYAPMVVNATHLLLNAPYAGATACTGTSGSNKGYMVFNSNVDVPYVGWGCQPFMCGLLGSGFAMASLATACTSPGVPTNCDSSTSGRLQGYVSDMAQWIANVGYDPVTQGVFQGANWVNCTPPSGNVLCNTGNLPYGERVVAQESSGGISWAYRFSGTSSFLTNLNAQFGAAWSNVSGVPDYNPPSGFYVSPTAGNVASQKYYGLQAGISSQAAFQAVRVCSIFPCLSPRLPANNVTLRATGCLASNSCSGAVSNATKYTMVMTEPNGLTATSICTTPTCTVTANLTQGSQVIVQITYLSAGNVQLAQGDPFVVVVQ